MNYVHILNWIMAQVMEHLNEIILSYRIDKEYGSKFTFRPSLLSKRPTSLRRSRSKPSSLNPRIILLTVPVPIWFSLIIMCLVRICMRCSQCQEDLEKLKEVEE